MDPWKLSHLPVISCVYFTNGIRAAHNQQHTCTCILHVSDICLALISCCLRAAWCILDIGVGRVQDKCDCYSCGTCAACVPHVCSLLVFEGRVFSTCVQNACNGSYVHSCCTHATYDWCFHVAPILCALSTRATRVCVDCVCV